MYESGKKYETMVGIGCGIEGVHAYRVPIDTVRFIHAASELRKDRTGALVVADLEVAADRVEYRVKILEQIVSLSTHKEEKEKGQQWDIVLQSQMPREEVSGIQISKAISTKSKKYAEEEARDARLILERRRGTKFGWVLDETRNKSGEIDPERSKGGELLFDQEIERNYPGQYLFTYTGVVGVPLTDGNGGYKCPYVVKESEIDQRLCIVGPETLDHEVAKLEHALEKKGKQAGRAIKAAQEFAQIILGRKAKDINETNLPALFREAQALING